MRDGDTDGVDDESTDGATVGVVVVAEVGAIVYIGHVRAPYRG
jgi:hypothetical protein